MWTVHKDGPSAAKVFMAALQENRAPIAREFYGRVRWVNDPYQENLGEAGYQVAVASNGDTGLQKARMLRPFAIILDVRMPYKDGWQVLHELKADPKTRDIPVIFLTIVDNKALGFELGAADYLVKPLDEQEVLSSLARLSETGGMAFKRLLVVDDDPQVADMVHQMLEGQAYIVETAADGVAALETIERNRPDVILLDLMMPQLDGFGVIERLRQDPEGSEIPIIVLTAKSLSGEESIRLRLSVAQVIQKQGLDEKSLIQELEKALMREKG
jgi:CheY-like chemotaxis protein